VTEPQGREIPASMGPTIIDVELLLHGWDLAEGSGQTIEISDEVVGYVAGQAEQIIAGGRGGAFGDEAGVAADAGALDRLAAYSGRRKLTA
jgi:uncharacterized protein (TIGR03086 family)